MRLVFVLCLVAAAVSAEVEPTKSFFKDVGIPAAQNIKKYEDAIFSKRNKIVGGVTAMVNAHPFLAGIIINFVNIPGQAACGSTLVSSNRLVTAAHCWNDGTNQASMFTVVLGSQYLFYGGTRLSTNNVIAHPQYSAAMYFNDVAIVILPQNILYSASIQPIALPTGNLLWEQFVGEWSMAVGYGKTSDSQSSVDTSTLVQEVNLQVIGQAQCTVIFGNYIVASTLCTNGAGGVGICGGDSGGPLFINRNGQNILIGISSFVAGLGCQLGYPSAFARVTSFTSFIQQYM